MAAVTGPPGFWGRRILMTAQAGTWVCARAKRYRGLPVGSQRSPASRLGPRALLGPRGRLVAGEDEDQVAGPAVGDDGARQGGDEHKGRGPEAHRIVPVPIPGLALELEAGDGGGLKAAWVQRRGNHM